MQTHEETMSTRRPPEPSHAAIIEVINVRFDGMERRLDQGEKRFDRLEAKMDHADEARSQMQADIASLKGSAVERAGPWWQRLLLPVGLVLLSLFAGGGLTLVALTQLDLLGPILDAARQAHGIGIAK